MDKGDFVLSVWREACRHDLEEAMDRVARLLAPKLPAAASLVLRRLDLQNNRIETITVGACREQPCPLIPRSDCTPEQFNRVLEWCGTGRLLRGSPSAEPLLGVVARADAGIDWLAGALHSGDQPIGLLLCASPKQTFAPQHEAVVAAVLEPLAVALANGLRMHELARYGEATEADNRALLSRLDRDAIAGQIIGFDGGLKHVMERVTQVAPTDAPVLILGETGSGKEVLARTIHARSRRASGPVVRVNCGALPPGLIDSELFGHERGSFTGASNVRHGWFERADGGTLFLDEIGELPLDAQVRLLRILQDGTFERVGGHKPLSVDVRIVTATHRDLQAMVARGGFREDLWYRISVFPIHLPPLRDRLEDVPALAGHFAAGAGKRLRGVRLAPSAKDIELLVSYDWPGNVRELASVIERAAILGNGRELEVAAALGRPTRRHIGEGRAWTPEASVELTRLATLDAVVARHIEVALRATSGRIEGARGAAALLDINPHTLRARMRKLKIDWGRFRSRGAARADVRAFTSG